MRLLDRAVVFRGYHAAVRTDYVPGFISRAFSAGTVARINRADDHGPMGALHRGTIFG